MPLIFEFTKLSTRCRCAHSKRVCDGYLPSPPCPSASAKGKSGHANSVRTVHPKPLSRRALAVAVRQLNAVGPTARILAPSPYLQNDVACFDFFRFRVTAVSSGEKGRFQRLRGFWDCTLLQAAHVEPAVWHAVAALGALYRKWEVVSRSEEPSTSVTMDAPAASVGIGASHDDEPGLAVYGEAAMDTNFQSLRLADQASSCYTRSLSLARFIRNPSALLVLSVALAATANLTGKWVESSVHIQAGQKLMNQMTKESRGRPMTETEVNAAESLARLNLQWASFAEERARYPYTENQEAGIDKDEIAHGCGQLEENGCSGLHRANMALVRIVQRILTEAGLRGMQNTPVDAPMDLREVLLLPTDIEQAIVRDLEIWESDLIRLRSRTAPTTSGHGSSVDLLGLKLLHTMARLLLAAGVMRASYNEMQWDDCLAYFERIVSLAVLILRKEAEANPLLPAVVSLDEPSMNMVLWLTTMRCRHPVLRRRALTVLQNARRLEGVWMSTSAAAAAARLVEVEEGSLELPAMVASAFCGGWEGLEREIIRAIEAEEDSGPPGSWLGPDVAWMAPRTRWDLPGSSLVPLPRRVTQVDVRGEYDPRVGKSVAELDLTFAQAGVDGEFRRQTVSINF